MSPTIRGQRRWLCVAVVLAAACSIGTFSPAQTPNLPYSYNPGPYDLDYDWDNQRYASFGVGFSPYDPILRSRLNYSLQAGRYNLNNAIAAQAYEAANVFNQQAIATARANAQAQQPLAPRYDIETRAPQTIAGSVPVSPPPAAPTTPPIPGNQLLGEDGRILWPPEAPNQVDSVLARRRLLAEAAVRSAVQQYQSNGRASVAAIADAKRKLYEYGKPLLTSLQRTNTTAAYALLTFLQNLELTLDRMVASPTPEQ